MLCPPLPPILSLCALRGRNAAPLSPRVGSASSGRLCVAAVPQRLPTRALLACPARAPYAYAWGSARSPQFTVHSAPIWRFQPTNPPPWVQPPRAADAPPPSTQHHRGSPSPPPPPPALAAYEEIYKVGISFHSGPKAPSVFEGVSTGYHRWMTSTMSNLFRGIFINTDTPSNHGLSEQGFAGRGETNEVHSSPARASPTGVLTPPTPMFASPSYIVPAPTD